MKAAAGIIETCELAEDGWSVGMSPASGALLWCAYEQSEILRPTKLYRDWRNEPFGLSYFPLAPYSNRIRDGRFDFDGKTVSIRPNAVGHEHPLHGVAWRADWSVVAQSRSSVKLRYGHEGSDAWPWAFSLFQDIGIEKGALKISLSMRNEARTRMPAGLGFHPYFSGPATARLKFSAAGYWRPDEDGLPAEKRDAAGEYDFSAGRALAGVAMDQCFTGWRGPALIEWTDRPFGVEVGANPSMAFAVVYVSEKENCFCFEPVSHMNDAVNWAARRADTGLRVLAPGEEWTATMMLRATKTGGDKK